PEVLRQRERALELGVGGRRLARGDAARELGRHRVERAAVGPGVEARCVVAREEEERALEVEVRTEGVAEEPSERVLLLVLDEEGAGAGTEAGVGAPRGALERGQ